MEWNGSRQWYFHGSDSNFDTVGFRNMETGRECGQVVKELLRIKRLWVQMLFGVVLFFPLLLHLRVMGPESSPLEERKKRKKQTNTNQWFCGLQVCQHESTRSHWKMSGEATLKNKNNNSGDKHTSHSTEFWPQIVSGVEEFWLPFWFVQEIYVVLFLMCVKLMLTGRGLCSSVKDRIWHDALLRVDVHCSQQSTGHQAKSLEELKALQWIPVKTASLEENYV